MIISLTYNKLVQHMVSICFKQYGFLCKKQWDIMEGCLWIVLEAFVISLCVCSCNLFCVLLTFIIRQPLNFHMDEPWPGKGHFTLPLVIVSSEYIAQGFNCCKDTSFQVLVKNMEKRNLNNGKMVLKTCIDDYAFEKLFKFE